MAFIPSGTEEGTEIGGERLLDVEAEALLQRTLVAVLGDVGNRVDMVQISRDGLAVVTHVGVVQIGQRANVGLQALKPLRLPFQLQVFGAGAAQIGIEIDAVGHRRHQGFPEAHLEFRPGIAEDRGDGIAAGIGGVIVSAIVIDSPIGKLQMAVAAYRVIVEKIHQPHLAHGEFNPLPGNRLLQIEGVGLFFDPVRHSREACSG